MVAQSNVILRDMLAQLKAIAPTADRDGKMTQEWLGDWGTYVGNREDYVNRLRVDPKARFLESPEEQRQRADQPADRPLHLREQDGLLQHPGGHGLIGPTASSASDRGRETDSGRGHDDLASPAVNVDVRTDQRRRGPRLGRGHARRLPRPRRPRARPSTAGPTST